MERVKNTVDAATNMLANEALAVADLVVLTHDGLKPVLAHAGMSPDQHQQVQDSFAQVGIRLSALAEQLRAVGRDLPPGDLPPVGTGGGDFVDDVPQLEAVAISVAAGGRKK